MKSPFLVVGAVVVVLGGGIIYAMFASPGAHPKTVATAPSTPPASATPAAPTATAPTPPPAVLTATASGDGASQANAFDSTGNPGGNGHHHKKHQGGGGQQTKQLFAQLDLTADQQQQIKQIRSTVTDHKERHAAIMKVLTPDQQTKLQQLRAQMTAAGGNGPGGPGAGAGNQ